MIPGGTRLLRRLKVLFRRTTLSLMPQYAQTNVCAPDPIYGVFLSVADQTLLIAFATTTKQLRVIRVAIKWGNKPGPNEKGQMPAPGQITVNPTLMIVHLAVTNWMDAMPTNGSEYVSQASMSVLSHLEIIPPAPEGLPAANQATLPTILTVRSYLPVSPSQFNQNIESVVDRWELRETPQTIHSAFDPLNSRRAGSSSQTPVSSQFDRDIRRLTFDRMQLRYRKWKDSQLTRSLLACYQWLWIRLSALRIATAVLSTVTGSRWLKLILARAWRNSITYLRLGSRIVMKSHVS